jgi:hypothetical protein
MLRQQWLLRWIKPSVIFSCFVTVHFSIAMLQPSVSSSGVIMTAIDDPRLQPGQRFTTEVDGTPVIVEIDEVIMVDADKQEAMVKSHIVSIPELNGHGS